MRAGVSKICITPPVGTWQGGYGARTTPCVGVHDDLYARAIVLEGDGEGAVTGTGTRAAIVSVDVVGLTHEVADGAKRRAEQMTGIPASQIALCASHTHGGPVLRPFVGRPHGPQVDQAYASMLEKYLAGAVVAAAQELRPVAVRLGRGAAGFNVNRRLRTAEGIAMRPNPEGVVDREVLALRVDEADGSAEVGTFRQPSRPPLAVLFQYTCHATAMGAQNYLITADYPGAAAETIERAYDGETAAIFLQGCAGDIRPNLTSEQGGFRSAEWEELGRLGRELGSATVAAAEHAAFGLWPGEDGVRAAGTTITLPYATPPEDGAEPGVPAEVQVFRLGGVWLVTLPGEVFVEIGWRVRAAVAAAVGVGADNVVVVAYANGAVGYVPTSVAMREGGYEVTAWHHAGRPSGFTTEAEDLLAEAAAKLAVGF